MQNFSKWYYPRFTRVNPRWTEVDYFRNKGGIVLPEGAENKRRRPPWDAAGWRSEQDGSKIRGNPKDLVFYLAVNGSQQETIQPIHSKENVMQLSKAVWAVVLGAGLACSTGVVLAQQCDSKGQMKEDMSSADAHLQKMSKELNLTDDQKAKLKPILTSQLEEIQGVHNDTSLTPPQRRSKMMEIGEKYRPQINAVLTPEQQAKWKAMRQEMMEKHKGQMGGGGGADHQ